MQVTFHIWKSFKEIIANEQKKMELLEGQMAIKRNRRLGQVRRAPTTDEDS